ncbi:MAG: Uma2 family endonuclease [Spirochaetota bacterium]|nr:Uma2 family endonuclease [Spirochaetota bacterium]
MSYQIHLKDLPEYSYEDYASWEGRWELIMGVPFSMKPSPGRNHHWVSNKIAYQINRGLDHCARCEVLPAINWKISENTVVCPDIAVYCDAEIVDYPTEAPALIVEILSPSTSRKDKNLKFDLCEREGVGY